MCCSHQWHGTIHPFKSALHHQTNSHSTWHLKIQMLFFQSGILRKSVCFDIWHHSDVNAPQSVIEHCLFNICLPHTLECKFNKFKHCSFVCNVVTFVFSELSIISDQNTNNCFIYVYLLTPTNNFKCCTYSRNFIFIIFHSIYY